MALVAGAEGFWPGVNIKLHFLHLLKHIRLVQIKRDLLNVECQACIKNVEATLRTADKYFTILRVIIDAEAVQTKH